VKANYPEIKPKPIAQKLPKLQACVSVSKLAHGANMCNDTGSGYDLTITDGSCMTVDAKLPDPLVDPPLKLVSETVSQSAVTASVELVSLE
jgi:hypothetical protein